ncbi:ABC transporter permease [Peptacetobacter hominis]|nr:ABC transporter permease subunit [Peptacetobacter hominis]
MLNSKKENIKAVFIWLFIWQIFSMLVGQEILLVSPISAFRKLIELSVEKEFWISIINSFVRITSGFFIAFILGSICAVFSYFSEKFRIMVEPLVLTVQSVPVASFIILALVWISSENLSTFISMLMVFPIVYRNILTGINSIPKEIVEMTRVFEVKISDRIRYIYLSEMAPYIKSACSVSLGLCWKAGIAAEVIGIPDGSIGEKLYTAKVYLNTPELFAWTIVIVVISICFQKIFLYIINRILERMGIL